MLPKKEEQNPFHLTWPDGTTIYKGDAHLTWSLQTMIRIEQMPTKDKYVTKKENQSSLGPIRTTIVQIPTPEQNMLRNKTISQKKKTFLLLDLVRPNNNM